MRSDRALETPPRSHRDRRALREDAELLGVVRGAAAGQSSAWEALARQFTPALRSVARGFRLSPHDVDDIVQATWLAALENIAQLRQPQALGAWLIVTARREAVRSLQRAVRERLVGDLGGCEAPGDAGGQPGAWKALAAAA